MLEKSTLRSSWIVITIVSFAIGSFNYFTKGIESVAGTLIIWVFASILILMIFAAKDKEEKKRRTSSKIRKLEQRVSDLEKKVGDN